MSRAQNRLFINIGEITEDIIGQLAHVPLELVKL